MAGKELEKRPDSTVRRVNEALHHEIIENARLIFRNFKGREGQYNPEGARNFAVILDDERAKRMEDAGWNIKYLKPREEGDEPTPYIQVAVGYKIRPPHVAILTSRGKTDLGQDEVELLDYVDIDWTDVIIRPFEWGPINGRSGVKAYLKTIFVKIQEDYLELKYSDVPEINVTTDAETPTFQITGGVDKEDDYEGMDIVDAELVD